MATNHLVNETSPYLLQHANNPVDWYPWNPAAIEKARQENKPILLSIGYAACHWCHVMAHESFEDDSTAALMNKHFINIKVDREERPDLDKIYQTTHQLLTQQPGGWPLTVFLTPDDLTPFFSGTYFPPKPQYGLPSFQQVLQGINDLFHNRSIEIKKQNQALQRILNQPAPTISDVRLNDQPIQHALKLLENSFDKVNGGFGTAPKFPQAPMLEFLLHTQTDLAQQTLNKMALGGIYDQLGGGFFRYSVDAKWMIPHFEKMLYDNAQLLYLYAKIYQLQPNLFLKNVITETAAWLMATMQASSGGYYSSLDADSEGKEGKYYVWSKQELQDELNPEELTVVTNYFGANLKPNFENEHHFYCAQPLQAVANEIGMPLANAEKLLNTAQQKLLAIRNKRPAPNCDTKILTAWNALAIKGMLVAGMTINDNKIIASAYQALDFIKIHLWNDTELKATLNHTAYLDDYAFLIDALLTALQHQWNTDYLNFAVQLAHVLLNQFAAPDGGFYFTAAQHEKVLFRPKTMLDDAIPSGNAILARAFALLGYLVGDTNYLQAAEKILHTAWPMVTQYPAQHCGLLLGIKEYLNPTQLVIIRANESELKSLQLKYQTPQRHVFAIPNHVNDLPVALQEKTANKIYICEGMKCIAVKE